MVTLEGKLHCTGMCLLCPLPSSFQHQSTPHQVGGVAHPFSSAEPKRYGGAIRTLPPQDWLLGYKPVDHRLVILSLKLNSLLNSNPRAKRESRLAGPLCKGRECDGLGRRRG